MTAAQLKAAYETAEQVAADKAQEAELFRKARIVRIQKEKMALSQAEKKINKKIESKLESKEQTLKSKLSERIEEDKA